LLVEESKIKTGRTFSAFLVFPTMTAVACVVVVVDDVDVDAAAAAVVVDDNNDDG